MLFNPNRGDIKLGQIRLLLRKAHMLSKKWGGVPVVLAGDFNSTPQSAIYKFLSSSEVNGSFSHYILICLCLIGGIYLVKIIVNLLNFLVDRG